MSETGTAEHGKNRDLDKLSGALDTVAEIVLGESLQAIRQSVDELDGSVSERLGAARKDAVESLERVKNELTERIDALAKKLDDVESRQQEALGELAERTRLSDEELEKTLQESESRAGERIEETKNDLEKEFGEKQDAFAKELDSLAQGLSAVQLEVQQHTDTLSRISGLLTGLGSVLAGQGGRSMPAPAATGGIPLSPDDGPADDDLLADAQDEAGDGDDPSISEDNLDNALDRMFGDSEN